MSGFTRGGRYGDRLVYEALYSKWARYHRHCGCREDWVETHALPAGFTIVKEGSGWVALVGPGLTEGVDEKHLTANALWEAVTGRPGTQDWPERVVVLPPPAPRKPRPRTDDGTEPAPSRAAWRSLNGEWVIRAKNVSVGDVITVGRRNGSETEETIEEILQEEPSEWCWARPAPRTEN